MRAFVAAADAQSLSEAARRLSVSPSAVSKALGRLEGRLGVRLLDRSTRNTRLTDEGALYYERCRRILQDVENAELELTQRHDQAAGTLRINASVPVAHYALAPLLGEFLRENPGVELELNVTDSVVDLFEHGADVAIRVGPLSDSSMRARKLGTIERVIVAAPSYIEAHGEPQSPRNLADHHCLNFNLGKRLNQWRFRNHGEVRPTGRLRTNCGDTLRHLALAGVGLARLGTFLVKDDLREGRLVELLEGQLDDPPEPVHAVFLGEAPIPTRLRGFVDFVADRIRFA